MTRPLPTALPGLGRSLRNPVLAGTTICVAFFGGFAAWSALVPLASAALGPGIVSPDGSRRAVQHLEGGIVERLLVRDGSRVRAGDPLLILEDKAARATHEMALNQYRQLLATEARLLAERDGGAEPEFPAELTDNAGQPAVAALMKAQRALMSNRLNSLVGRRDLLWQRIAEIHEEIEGLEGQILSRARQLAIIREEIATVGHLVEKGLTPKPRLLALQREQAELSGQQATSRAAIARSRQSIGESEQKIAMLDVERQEDLSKELAEVASKLSEVRERMVASADILRRIVVSAPVAGTVVQLQVHTVGGVVGAGDTILDIVPRDDDLVIDARIAPTDIDVIREGQTAQIVLSAFQQRNLPRIEGRVRTISADRIIDPKTSTPYYQVRIEVDRSQLAAIGAGIELTPGMPAEVMVVTGQRTAFDYLAQPFLDSLRRSLKES